MTSFKSKRVLSFLLSVVFLVPCLAAQEVLVPSSHSGAPAHREHFAAGSENSRPSLHIKEDESMTNQNPIHRKIADQITQWTQAKEKYLKLSESKNSSTYKGLYVSPYERAISELEAFEKTITHKTSLTDIEREIYLITQRNFPADEDHE